MMSDMLDIEDSILSVQGRLETVALLLDNYFHVTDEDAAFDRVNSIRLLELLSEQVHNAAERLDVIVKESASLRLRGKKQPVMD